MKNSILILGLVFMTSFSVVFGQDLSYSIPLDSANVINNAILLRTVSGVRQYVMMPTQYGTDLSIGQPLIVTVNNTLKTAKLLRGRNLRNNLYFCLQIS